MHPRRSSPRRRGGAYFAFFWQLVLFPGGVFRREYPLFPARKTLPIATSETCIYVGLVHEPAVAGLFTAVCLRPVSTPADAQRQGRCSRPRRDRRGRVVAPRLPLLAAAAAAPRAPTKNAAVAAAVVVDSSSLPLLAAGLLLRPWPASLRRRRERCCLEAFPAALLSSAPRKWFYLELLAGWSTASSQISIATRLAFGVPEYLWLPLVP